MQKIVKKKFDVLDSSKLKTDNDYLVLKKALFRLKSKYKISPFEILNIVESTVKIPISIFNDQLSPLDTVVKYLKENLNFDFNKISAKLNRSNKTIWQAYDDAIKKSPENMEIKASPYYFDISILSERKLSILELVVEHLKEKYSLPLHEIAVLLQRDDRTIWTVYSRAKKKRGSK